MLAMYKRLLAAYEPVWGASFVVMDGSATS